MFSCDTDKIDFETLIGKGTFGSVYPYRSNPKKNQKYVVKVMETQSFEKLLTFIEEIVLGFSCQHPSILPLKGYSIKKEKLSYAAYLRMPQMMGSLRQLIKNMIDHDIKLSEADIIKHFYSLASGLDYLHKKSISHRDIKPENILIDWDGKLQISDIGGGLFISEDETSVQSLDTPFGTKQYLPDEGLKLRLKNKDFYKIDSWSLGTLIGELCTTKRLLASHIHGEEKRKNYFEEISQKGYSSNLVECIQGLMRLDPETRLSVQEVKELLEKNFEEILNDPGQTIQTNLNTITNFQLKKVEKIEEIQAETKRTNVKKTEEEKKMEESSFKKQTPVNSNEALLSSLNLVKASIENQWKSKFELEVLDMFSLKAVNEDSFANKALQEFMTNFKEKIAENGLNSLTEFSLNLEGYIYYYQISYKLNKRCDSASNAAILEMVKIVHSTFPQLKTLKLDLGFCSGFTDQGLQAMGLEFYQRFNLKNLSLNLLKYKCTTSCNNELHRCDELTDLGIQNFVSSFQTKYRQLEKLELNFEGCSQIRNRGFKEISEFGPENKILKHLSINLSNCEQINDDNAKGLIENIFEKLHSLEHLNLDFSICSNLTDKTIFTLSESITQGTKKKPNRIKEFHISFSNCSEISDEGIESLAGTLTKHFGQLLKLSLDFRECSSITEEEGFSKLIKSIGAHLKELTHLQLGFSGETVTSEGIEIFTQELQGNLKNLESLALNFSECTEISEESFIKFVKNLGENNNNLNTVDFNFGVCESISNEGIDVLGDVLCKQLQNLQELKLSFFSCRQITIKTIENFLTKIEERSNQISKMNIGFGRKKLTEEGEKIKTRLKQKNPNILIM